LSFIITTAYDQPYIYFLWYGGYSPKNQFNTGEFNKSFDNFIFREVFWHQDKKLEKTLIIASPQEVKEPLDPIWSVNFLDGSPAFLAFESDSI